MLYKFLFIFSLFALLFRPAVIIAEERLSIAEGEYNLKVSFDIPNSKITGRAKIFAQKDRELIFHTGRLAIKDVRLNGEKIEFDAHHGALKILPQRDGIVEIIYEGIFREDSQGRETGHGIISNIIDERGISLTGIWYPYIPGLFKYSLSAFLPEGYEAVSEAERIEKTVRNGVAEFFFDFPHPVDGINFIATNRWEIIKDYYENTEIYAYFFPEDIGLARKYIEYTKKYLKLYEDMLGEYPYKRFSIVTNFLPTGYSMPTSGVMVIALDDKSYYDLAEQFKKRTINRKYVTLVYGNIKEDSGEIEMKIGRAVSDRKKMSTRTKRGKEAVTRWKIIKRFIAATLIEAKLGTGRTHQIRVHFSAIGHPVLGDKTYGKKVEVEANVEGKRKKIVFSRQMLHAETLGFIHPITKKYIEFSSPLPEDMEECIRKLSI